MAKAGHRYSLVIYTHMLNRWWPATLTLSLALFAVAWGVSRTPDGQAQPNLVTATVGLGGFVLVFTLLLFIFRKAAYVRPFRGTTTSEMRALFPPQSLSSWRRGIIASLSSMTAIVINLNGYPVSPALLRLFLSPFFFKPRIGRLLSIAF